MAVVSLPLCCQIFDIGLNRMNEALVQGVVHLVEETKTYGQKGFRKRLVVLKQENGRFPNFIPVEFIQDGCDLADDIREGETIEIKYRLGGRKWQRDQNSEVKYFLSCEALSFKHLGGGGSDAADADAAPPTIDEPPVYQDDDIPF